MRPLTTAKGVTDRASIGVRNPAGHPYAHTEPLKNDPKGRHDGSR